MEVIYFSFWLFASQIQFFRVKTFFLVLFYSTLAGVVPCGGRVAPVKSLHVHHHSAGCILFPLGSLSLSRLF